MNKLLPGITLKIIICCIAVSSVISYGTCALYLTLKANSARIFEEQKTHKFDQPRMNSVERSLALQ
jgi:hypothetical protein